MMPSAKLLNSRIFKGLSLLLPLTLAGAIASPTYPQAGPPRTLSVRSDIQEADSKTGIVTARGNVQINYPARQIQATAAQAQYFSRERRIILSGDVYVLQQGNSLRGETITYLIDEGRFIALPDNPGQVESVYLVAPEQDAAAQNAVGSQRPPVNPQPAIKPPASPRTAPR
ncbi:OstA family protein [Oscillatoria nigro-viridis PCC 7112]|uniref:OstA family protein n=1 Tax=Phormidium nigroviride PCC 7112 TaxID=179408 RepID=K9V9E1_9CYAN|nr:LptA/OstA family protein [Oscillatoria nigro-viridis]AFZ04693.1 OstA family protein [Oscillatoria nigro-viridis PCC 7112]